MSQGSVMLLGASRCARRRCPKTSLHRPRKTAKLWVLTKKSWRRSSVKGEQIACPHMAPAIKEGRRIDYIRKKSNLISNPPQWNQCSKEIPGETIVSEAISGHTQALMMSVGRGGVQEITAAPKARIELSTLHGQSDHGKPKHNRWCK